MSFLAGVFYTGGHGYGQTIPDGQVPIAISVTAVRPTSMPLCSCDTNLDDLAPARIDGAMLGPADFVWYRSYKLQLLVPRTYVLLLWKHQTYQVHVESWSFVLVLMFPFTYPFMHRARWEVVEDNSERCSL
jgi:hypothetical protein